MAANVRVDVTELNEFFAKVETASAAFKEEIKTWLDGVGNEFLRVVQDEIIRREVVDTRLLLNSFEKSNDGNIWQIEQGGLVLEVGSSVDYAAYVNDGHWSNPAGVETRFVPGTWSGSRFIYDPHADGGMVLHQQWVNGKPYFDSALLIMEKMFPDFLEAKLDDWLEKYFS